MMELLMRLADGVKVDRWEDALSCDRDASNPDRTFQHNGNLMLNIRCLGGFYELERWKTSE